MIRHRHGMINGPTNLPGWAVLAFVGDRSHYWTVPENVIGGEYTPVVSMCGLERGVTMSVPALGDVGSERCKTCLASIGHDDRFSAPAPSELQAKIDEATRMNDGTAGF